METTEVEHSMQSAVFVGLFLISVVLLIAVGLWDLQPFDFISDVLSALVAVHLIVAAR
jgi:hypothetical protein